MHWPAEGGRPTAWPMHVLPPPNGPMPLPPRGFSMPNLIPSGDRIADGPWYSGAVPGTREHLNRERVSEPQQMHHSMRPDNLAMPGGNQGWSSPYWPRHPVPPSFPASPTGRGGDLPSNYGQFQYSGYQPQQQQQQQQTLPTPSPIFPMFGGHTQNQISDQRSGGGLALDSHNSAPFSLNQSQQASGGSNLFVESYSSSMTPFGLQPYPTGSALFGATTGVSAYPEYTSTSKTMTAASGHLPTSPSSIEGMSRYQQDLPYRGMPPPKQTRLEMSQQQFYRDPREQARGAVSETL